jgi:microcystin-dependent protein
MMFDASAPALQTTVPVGTVVTFAGTLDQVPAGWLECDGRRLSVSTYSVLFGVIGSAFGGDEATYFYLPDLRGKFVRGVDHGAKNDPDVGKRGAQNAQVQGVPPYPGNTTDNVGSTQSSALATHQHYNSLLIGDGGFPGWEPHDGGIPGPPRAATFADGGTSSETRPINVYLYYIIYTGYAGGSPTQAPASVPDRADA